MLKTIEKLKKFWRERKYIEIPSYDFPMGAATFHPSTVFTACQKNEKKFFYTQVCRRPGDGRCNQNTNRYQKFTQFQVVCQPAFLNVCQVVKESLHSAGLKGEVQFWSDNWKSPTIGAFGNGWEVTYNGCEILQITYFQKMGDKQCPYTCLELAYGIERLCMCIQKTQGFKDLKWQENIKYNYIVQEEEKALSDFSFFTNSNEENLKKNFNFFIENTNLLLKDNFYMQGYENILMANHYFNLLDARGCILHEDRKIYIDKLRKLTSMCTDVYLKKL